jgi:hypothetical protein
MLSLLVVKDCCATCKKLIVAGIFGIEFVSSLFVFCMKMKKMKQKIKTSKEGGKYEK